MVNKIFRSILSASLVALACSVALILFVLYGYFGTVQKEQLHNELDLVQQAIETSGFDYLKSLDPTNERFTYIQADGKVLYDTSVDASKLENHADRKEVQEARSQGYGESSRYSNTLLHETVYYAKLLPNHDVLRVSSIRVSMLAILIKMIQPILIMVGLVSVLALILAKKMAQKIVQPLNQLDLNHPLQQEAYEELTPLLIHIENQKLQIQNQKTLLLEAKSEFDHVVQDMKEGLVLLNEKQEILSLNPFAQEILDAKGSIETIDELSMQEAKKFILESYTMNKNEMTYHKDGRYYQFYANRIVEENQPCGLVILILDATEKIQAEKSRREFTANVSHELKTPLHAIMGRAELLEDQLVQEKDIPIFAKEIHTKATCLLEMVEKLINLSRLDERVEEVEDHVQLDGVIVSEIESLQSIASSHHVSLSYQLDPIETKTAPSLWQEITKNLVENAIVYNHENGRVDVSLQLIDQTIVLKVKDTGIGIPESKKQRVFERFYQVDKSSSVNHHGSGLGLSIVKHAVDDLNGKIHIEQDETYQTIMVVEVPMVHHQ